MEILMLFNEKIQRLTFYLKSPVRNTDLHLRIKIKYIQPNGYAANIVRFYEILFLMDVV